MRIVNQPIGKDEIEERLAGLREWEWANDKLVKAFRFQGFREAMSFLVRVSYEAEQRNHHPEIFNCYDRVTLSLNTHDAGGKVTEKDFDLAKAIDSLL